MLLEDLVAARLARGERGHLRLVGPKGSGRTTALRHLAHCFGTRADLVLLDHASDVEELEFAHGALLLSTGVTGLPHGECWRMAPWSDDDRIEYLLDRHRPVCGSVLARCQDTLAWIDLEGSAALWSACLDELALDPEAYDLAAALSRVLERALDTVPYRPELRALLLNGLLREDEREERGAFPSAVNGGTELLRSALKVPSAALCLGAIIARRELLLDPPCVETWRRPWRTQAIEAVACVFPLGERPLAEVERATRHERTAVRFKAMGVLHLLDPARSARALISLDRSPAHREWLGVGFSGISLPAAVIFDCKLRRCGFRRADLEGAQVMTVEANGADFRAVRMCGSTWSSVTASDSDFAFVEAAGAVFRRCEMRRSSWIHAHLESSRWEGVTAPYSRFEAAQLAGAEFLDCWLRAVDMRSVDLSRAVFSHCTLSSCDFRATRLAETVFRHCRMPRTQWSSVVLRDVELSDCYLKKADFTDSVLTSCSLRGSSLVEVGLAQVSWVGCDLRDVDFTHASFHLGSTRSGLLIGAPPSWGTRTGFYPRDDGLDSNARPEQVRKADLRECDLRGAEVGGCDFYLVDLRGASLSAAQVDHLRRCRAILDPDPRVE